MSSQRNSLPPTKILLQTLEQVRSTPERLADIRLDWLPEGSEERLFLQELVGILAEAQENERTRRLSDQRYEELIDSIDGIVWEADAQTFEFTFVSQQAERILGYDPQLWTEHATFWQDHIHSEDQGWAPSFCAVATTEMRPHQFEYRMVAADGRVVWLHDIVTVVVENGRPVKLRGVMLDVSERKYKEEQYRGIFEATGDGLIIMDMDDRVVEVNPAFCQMHGYSYEEMLRVTPQEFVHPNSYHLFAEFIETAKAGRQFQCQATDVRKDGTPFPIEVHGNALIYNGKPHLLGVVRDISDRLQTYEILEQRVQERTRELSTLLDISHNIASKLEVEPLLAQMLKQLRTIVDYDWANIYVVADQEVRVWRLLTAKERDQHEEGYRLNIDQVRPLWDAVRENQFLILGDVRAANDLAVTYRKTSAAIYGMDEQEIQQLIESDGYAMRSWLMVPVALQERTIGMLSLLHAEIDYYTPHHAALLVAIANQAAVAIENARLYEEANESARTAAAQAQIASRVALGGPLATTLDDVCAQMMKATGAVAATIALREPDSERLHIANTAGHPTGYAETLDEFLEAGGRLMVQDALAGRQPLVVDDLRRRLRESSDYTPLQPFTSLVPWDTVVATPMIYRDEPTGVMLSYHPATHIIGVSELRFHAAIADQAAVAIENARLLAEVQKRAAAEQRQHLARELHDSVLQALFSISLTARSIEIMLKRDGATSDDVNAALGDLRVLTAGAMAEMRALIFELRPGALEEEGLLAALRKHAAAVQGRQQMAVEVVCVGEGGLPRLKPTAEEALYRIAQEALHNAVKHARASRVTISLDCSAANNGAISLQVADNGTGFDPASVPAGHMGLGTMGQRATALAADYRIESQPGAGTVITVRVPADKWRMPEQH